MIDEAVTIEAMRAEFPAFHIWRELVGERSHYVARSRYWGLNPHTVITPDLAELRGALAPAAPAPVPGGEPARRAPVAGSHVHCALLPVQANIARMYDYWLDGKEHYAADRAAADTVAGQFPEVAEIARANRAFLTRAVRHVAAQGVSQFIDAGSGLPASPNVHELVRSVNPDARVAYVDRDPVVLAHARAMLATDPGVAVVAGDLRRPGHVLADPALVSLIDRSQPVCLLLLSVLHFLPAGDADLAVAAFRDWLAPGSYLVITAGTSTGTDPALIAHLRVAYAGAAPVVARTEAEIAAWFDGFTLDEPGLTEVQNWRPDTPARPGPSRARFLAGVGRRDHVRLRQCA